MPKTNIALVGFMGSGKTAVGELLASSLNLQFVDLDDLIEVKEGKKINQIFAEKGEPYFRMVEKQITQQAAQKQNQVIACGGGVVLDKDNVQALKRSGILVYLKVSPEVVLERTKGYSHRPLLNVKDPRKKVEELLNFRKEYYEQADCTVDTSNLTVEEVVSKILALVKKQND